jgi:hypothetical protein
MNPEKLLAAIMLVALTFGAGLQVSRENLVAILKNYWLHARAFLANFVIVPAFRFQVVPLLVRNRRRAAIPGGGNAARASVADRLFRGGDRAYRFLGTLARAPRRFGLRLERHVGMRSRTHDTAKHFEVWVFDPDDGRLDLADRRDDQRV